MVGKSTFQEEWLDPARNPDWAPWIRRTKVKTEAYCFYCRKEINIVSMGRQAIISHAKSDRHISNIPGRSADQPSLQNYGVMRSQLSTSAATPAVTTPLVVSIEESDSSGPTSAPIS